MRVATINIHQSVPGDQKLGDANEDIRALGDVASYIKQIDADVVLVQEVDDDRAAPGKQGVTDQYHKLVELADVTDSAFTPAMAYSNGDLYGTAILTRNGYTIGDVHNVDLPDPLMAEDRGAAISDVRAPDGTRFTVVNTHLAHKLDHQSDRPLQLRALGEQLRVLVRDGEVAYEDAISGQQKVAAGLDTSRMVFGGDLNTFAEIADGHFWPSGLRNVMFEPDIVADPDRRERAQAPSIGKGDRAVRIDHVYVNDAFAVDDVWVDDVPAKDLPKGPPTDHRAVVTDIRERRAPVR